MDIKPALFATAECPIRASALPGLVQCGGSVFMDPVLWEKQTVNDEDGGGEAAQTGNLIHQAAEAYHRFQGATEAQRTEAGLAALEAARAKFPQGRPDTATRHFLCYAADPDNLDAEVVHNEKEVTFEIPCATFDPTGKPVYIRGKLDQVRRDRATGELTLWDIKTGSFYYGQKALSHYVLQQAAYVLGARWTYKEDIQAGGLICTYGYTTKPKPKQVFFYHQWTAADAQHILFPVLMNVAAMRSGKVVINPGDACKWCKYKHQDQCRLVAKTFNLL